MTKSQMETYALVPPPPYPLNFQATHNIGLCPLLRVTLTWDNGGHLEQKVIEFSTNGVNFQVLGTVGENATSFQHSPPSEGTYWYRIRWASAPPTQYAQDIVGVVCPI